MKTKDQIDTIKATVLYILKEMHSEMDYIKLFKIMYFAQRESLASYGLPIMEDTFRARQRGPVPTLTYKVIKIKEMQDDIDENSDLYDFAKSIDIKNKKVIALEEPDMDYLSVKDREIIDSIISRYGDKSSEELSEISHDAIYKKVMENAAEDPQKDIFSLIDIARSGGASEEMVEYIREKEIVRQKFV